MKKFLALMLAMLIVFALVACGEPAENPGTSTSPSDSQVSGTSSVHTDEPSETDKNTDSETDNTTTEEWKPLDVVDNLVIACDQLQSRIVIYDMDVAIEKGNLDAAEVWEFENCHTASIKYRENTVYGNVVVTSSYTDGPTIIKYPSKEVVWKGGAGCAGNNPHSVEILPSGNMLSAASTGNTLRIYNNANVIAKGDKLTFETYELIGAHGVLYDPENNYVWALGSAELVAYAVVDNKDGTESLKKIGGVGGALPSPADGHDLSADLMDSNFLWITSNKGVVRFDKENNSFKTSFPQSNKVSKPSTKGFGNNQNNNYVFCYPNGGEGRSWASQSIADWCTDTLYYGTWIRANYLVVKPYVSETSAIYKAHMFNGKYQ